MNKLIKGILIDTKNKCVKEVEIDSDNFLQECYKLIGCQLIECVSGITEEHDLWVDEEGLFNSENDFFVIDGYPTPLRGNGIIFGLDKDTYDSCSHKLNVDEITEKVLFADKEIVYEQVGI